MCEPVSCLALGGAACYGCREFARPLTDRITAARVRARKRKEGIQLRAAASATTPTQSELAVAALWRFAHLMLARARGFHDQAARAAALRLVICDDIPLDAVRVIAVTFHEQVDARKLKLREPTFKERYLAKLPLPGLRHGEDDGGAEKDKRRLAKDAFFALGSLAMTSRCVARPRWPVGVARPSDGRQRASPENASTHIAHSLPQRLGAGCGGGGVRGAGQPGGMRSAWRAGGGG